MTMVAGPFAVTSQRLVAQSKLSDWRYIGSYGIVTTCTVVSSVHKCNL